MWTKIYRELFWMGFSKEQYEQVKGPILSEKRQGKTEKMNGKRRKGTMMKRIVALLVSLVLLCVCGTAMRWTLGGQHAVA